MKTKHYLLKIQDYPLNVIGTSRDIEVAQRLMEGLFYEYIKSEITQNDFNEKKKLDKYILLSPKEKPTCLQ